MLWNLPEYKLQDFDVVPVYAKSNINHVYIIGTADGEKVEIPLWQITEPVSKSKARKIAEGYKEFTHEYATVKLDGLPCRAEPANTSKQVYRFRKGETAKILAKGNGEKVMAGKEVLEGDWLKVITKDGTQGWCFSHNLALFQMDADGNHIGVQEAEETFTADDVIESIFDKPWYPEQFRIMVESENIDTTLLKPDYNFTIDSANGKVTMAFPENKDAKIKAVKATWDYEGYEKIARNQYQLKGLPLVVTCRKDDFIVLRFTNSSGKPVDYSLVTIEDDVTEIIKNEKDRRNSLYSKIVSTGPNYMSSSYGNLNLSRSGFSWSGNDLLVPKVIPAEAKAGGTVSFKYGVDKKLSSQYDGVLSFKFDGVSKEVNFLFKVESDGLRLEDATDAKFEEGMVLERSSTSLVLYFKASE